MKDKEIVNLTPVSIAFRLSIGISRVRGLVEGFRCRSWCLNRLSAVYRNLTRLYKEGPVGRSVLAGLNRLSAVYRNLTRAVDDIT